MKAIQGFFVAVIAAGGLVTGGVTSAQAYYNECPLGSSCSWGALNFNGTGTGLLNQGAKSGVYRYADETNDETSSVGNRHSGTGGDTSWFIDGEGSGHFCVSTGKNRSYVGDDFNDEISLMRVYHESTIC